MQLNTIVEKIREAVKSKDAAGMGFMAVQINLTDLDPGVFYVEIKDEKINVEPYDYHDRQCAISIKSSDFIKLISGKLDPVLAFTVGKLKVDGDLEKAIEFAKLIK